MNNERIQHFSLDLFKWPKRFRNIHSKAKALSLTATKGTTTLIKRDWREYFLATFAKFFR